LGRLPILCRNKSHHGKGFCVTDCPAVPEGGVFLYSRVEKPADLPARDDRIVDVAILDMNHGWPNLGHDSLVHAVMDAACDLVPALEGTDLRMRAVSFDVRRGGGVPEGPDGRFAVYVGTGGPGHIDPRSNDGIAPAAQGVVEDPSWEAPLFALFDDIKAAPGAALLSVCHSFGVMCRWAGTARPVLRGVEKGGKSVGILDNLLTPEAHDHPWFRRFAESLRDGRRFRVVDHRLFDLIPVSGDARVPGIALSQETRGSGGPAGDALTMMEFARDAGGVMPRVLGVNHHPEIVDRSRQMMILRQKRERGEVTAEWFLDRARALTETYPDDTTDRRLQLTSDYTLLGPLRFYVHRQVRLRAEGLGLDLDVDEDRVLEEAGPAVPAAKLEGSGAV
jgi:hypothetical protein